MLAAIFPLLFFSSSFALDGDVSGSIVPKDIKLLSDSIKQVYAPDKRVALFDVDYTCSGKNVMLCGVTTLQEAKDVLIDGLDKAHYKVMDCLQVLPDEQELGDKTYGIINLSVASMRVEPDYSSEMMTQALMGMPVRVLQCKNWYRIQTPDNYIAWVHRTGIHLVTKEELTAWNQAETGHLQHGAELIILQQHMILPRSISVRVRIHTFLRMRPMMQGNLLH